MSIVTLAYNPNDFFYASSYNTPSDLECTQFLQNNAAFSQCSSCYDNINTIAAINGKTYTGGNVYTGTNGNLYINNCDIGFWNDFSGNCYLNQLCQNKSLAISATKMQNNYAGSDQRYADISKQYDYAVLHTINIISGFIVIGGLTFYYLTKK